MNKTRRRAIQKHRARELKFEQRRRAETAAAPPTRPRPQAAAGTPGRSRQPAREQEPAAGGASG